MLARRAAGALLRRATARLDGVRSLAAAGGDPTAVLREVESLPLPEKLRARAGSLRGAAADAANSDPELDAAAQIAPYQALPVTGKITRHIIRGLPVIEPSQDVTVREEKSRIEAIDSIIKEYGEYLKDRTDYHLGYPYNLDFDFGALEGLLKYSINNLGDPFIESNYGVHSRQFEIGVLQWFARLWEISEDDYWGYITNCGTEGNLHGILVGREVLPDGILYASSESHYSVFKAARMYRMDSVKIETLETGEIDYDDLRKHLLANKGIKPAILNLNIGTTVKGAVDDLDRVLKILEECGYPEDKFFIHCDGALFGMMLPFIKDAPMVTFAKPIGSVSVSGHKFVGVPMPCGVVITRMKHVRKLSSDIEYLNSRDATIMGSRNGHAPIFMWHTLTRKGYEGMRKDVEKCLRNAVLLRAMLEKAGVKVLLNELSSTVVFERPQDEAFVKKWQLACEGDIAHVIVMPNVTLPKLEQFAMEYIESRAKSAALAAKGVAAKAREVDPKADE